MIDYRRRTDGRWWKEAGLWVWLNSDGGIHGTVALNAVTETEWANALGQRWPTRLRPIDPSKLREEVFSLVGPEVIYRGALAGRYQPIRFAVWPCRKRRIAAPSTANLGDGTIEPMPFVF